MNIRRFANQMHSGLNQKESTRKHLILFIFKLMKLLWKKLSSVRAPI